MLLPDVNVLINTHRRNGPEFHAYQQWFADLLASDSAFGISELVLSGFVRIVTNPQVFSRPTPLRLALAFAAELRTHPRSVIIRPGDLHWDIFSDLCRKTDAAANRIPDAYFAAMAIESGCIWVTADKHFNQFPGLRCQHPLTGRKP